MGWDQLPIARYMADCQQTLPPVSLPCRPCQDEGGEEITDTEYVIIRGEANLNAIRAPSHISEKLPRYHGHVRLSRHLNDKPQMAVIP